MKYCKNSKYCPQYAWFCEQEGKVNIYFRREFSAWMVILWKLNRATL